MQIWALLPTFKSAGAPRVSEDTSGAPVFSGTMTSETAASPGAGAGASASRGAPALTPAAVTAVPTPGVRAKTETAAGGPRGGARGALAANASAAKATTRTFAAKKATKLPFSLPTVGGAVQHAKSFVVGADQALDDEMTAQMQPLPFAPHKMLVNMDPNAGGPGSPAQPRAGRHP